MSTCFGRPLEPSACTFPKDPFRERRGRSKIEVGFEGMWSQCVDLCEVLRKKKKNRGTWRDWDFCQ